MSAALLLIQAFSSLPFLSCTIDAGGVSRPAIVRVDCGLPAGRGSAQLMPSGFYAGEIVARLSTQPLQAKRLFVIPVIAGDVLPRSLKCWDRGAGVICADEADLTEIYATGR